MGNRSWLYLTDNLDVDDGYQLAAANNLFPTLWKMLLASGQHAEGITFQRVFGDRGTRNLASDARAALQRLDHFAHFAARNRTLRQIPILATQLRSLVCYLTECVGRYTGDVWFSANLDELSWLEEDSPSGFIEQCAKTCDVVWYQVARSIDRDNAQDAIEALEIGEPNKWLDWARCFGLSGIEHPYFKVESPPSHMAWEDYVPPQRRHFLAGDLWLFESGGRWGVCFDDDVTTREIICPTWTEFSAAASRPHMQTWVHDGTYFGLLDVIDNTPRITLEPQLDAVTDFSDDGFASVTLDGKDGLLRRDGTWQIEPRFDWLDLPEKGRVIARVDDKLGFLDINGAWLIDPCFDDVDDFTAGELALAALDERWGLIDAKGQWRVEPQWTSADWQPEMEAFLVGLGDDVGLVSPHGETVIPVRYAAIALMSMHATADCLRDPAESLIGAQDAAGRCGLFDGTGKVLVPFDYAGIAPTDWLSNEAQMPHVLRNRYVSVTHEHDKDAALQGIYDLLERREVVAANHYTVVVGMHWSTQTAWLACAPARGAQYAIGDHVAGVLSLDGKLLHAPVYAWIGLEVDTPWLAAYIIQTHWSAGEPVNALRADNGTFEWLYADGRVESQSC
ncbi:MULTISPECIES: WG repeat-containing protein [unclassified Paraburkholderia]|uniref:WG repeat-containing protein n=1 Tax=unclassified Paraburkholderia TaxID=2615204 RepID=UPI002AAF477B|nr:MULTISPECIES: WG repeat-containing protein [unclassified Paraburkholderia]